MTNLKKKIAGILGITVLSLGGVQINVNIQTKQFYEDLANGELKVNAFNVGAYKKVAKGLADEMDAFLLGGKPLTYQGLGIFLQMVSKEAGEDSFKTMEKIKNKDTGILELVEVEKTGWNLKANTQEELLQEMNNKLKSKLK